MDKHFILTLHIALATSALLIGALIVAAPKGTRPHRRLGWLWGCCMVGVASSSLAFPAERLLLVGGVSYLHLLAVATFFMLPLAIRAARQGNTLLHSRLMLALYSLLCLTGVAAMFMPGRFLYRLFFA
jgi:uncharacterized membrane protein